MFKRAARRVKEWRRLHDDMSQLVFARRAKVALGTLQAFESGRRITRKTNLMKIAAAIGLTTDQLLAEDDPVFVRPHPLLRDLRTEDLQIANAFHHAGAEAKHTIKVFFAPDVTDDQRERIALLLKQLLTLRATEHFDSVEAFLLQATAPSLPATVPARSDEPVPAPKPAAGRGKRTGG